jgi:hypothetical protein
MAEHADAVRNRKYAIRVMFFVYFLLISMVIWMLLSSRTVQFIKPDVIVNRPLSNQDVN